MEDCEGEHAWEPTLEGYGRWYGCKKCMVLGRLEKLKIVPVKCVDCDENAITLNERKPGVFSPVCADHFTGIILR